MKSRRLFFFKSLEVDGDLERCLFTEERLAYCNPFSSVAASPS